MKKWSALFIFVAFAGTTPFTVAAGFDRRPCNFDCWSIPQEKDVLKNFGRDTKSSLKSLRMNVLVWNIYKGRMRQFSDSFAKLAEGKDLILLSEATTRAVVLDAMENQKSLGWDFATSFELEDQAGTGTAVGSYARSHDVGFYKTTDLEPFVKSPKVIISARYALPDRKEALLVLSIHGINWAGDQALERQLRATVADLQRHNGPVLFAGDFNTKNSKRLQIAKRVLGEAGLQRVTWLNPEGTGQLDEAFTRGLKVHRAELVREYINSGSDHPAIVLDIEAL